MIHERVKNAMSDDIDIQRKIIDEEHLRLLALFHYISGGITIAFSSLFIFHLVFMSYFAFNPDFFPFPEQDVTGPDPVVIFRFVSVMIGVFVFMGVTYGVLQIISGRFISQHRHRIFSFIVAIPNVLLIPYGTILCVFTLMVLERKSVKNLYFAGSSN